MKLNPVKSIGVEGIPTMFLSALLVEGLGELGLGKRLLKNS